ncbi:hypothetical protein V3C99_010088 [Haemonchus contortus]
MYEDKSGAQPIHPSTTPNRYYRSEQAGKSLSTYLYYEAWHIDDGHDIDFHRTTLVLLTVIATEMGNCEILAGSRTAGPTFDFPKVFKKTLKFFNQ